LHLSPPYQSNPKQAIAEQETTQRRLRCPPPSPIADAVQPCWHNTNPTQPNPQQRYVASPRRGFVVGGQR
jgi:hypothetical protein